MAKHDVTFTVPERQLGKVDVEFLVKRNGQVLGRLRVSKGRVEWIPKNGQKGHAMPWMAFAQLIEQNWARE